MVVRNIAFLKRINLPSNKAMMLAPTSQLKGNDLAHNNNKVELPSSRTEEDQLTVTVGDSTGY